MTKLKINVILKGLCHLNREKSDTISRDELETFYFSSDEGARKIIVREFIEGNKGTFSRLIQNFIFVLSHFRVKNHPISRL